MTMTKTSKLLSATLAALLVVLVAGMFLHNRQNSTSHVFTEDELATVTAQNGEMSKQEALNLDRIDFTAEKQGLITGADLDWTLNLLKTPVESSNPFAAALRRSAAMAPLRKAKNLTPAEEDKIYRAVSPLLASSRNVSASSNKLEKTGAISVMKNTRDKRSLPTLTHLLEDADPQVRSFAQITIKAINS